MSKREHICAVTHELEKLNRVIDEKIIKGKSYRSEAKRHLELLRLLKKSRPRFNFLEFVSRIALF